MRRKNAWLTKALPSILAAAMVVGSTPTVALAETGDASGISQTAVEADLVSRQDGKDEADELTVSELDDAEDDNAADSSKEAAKEDETGEVPGEADAADEEDSSREEDPSGEEKDEDSNQAPEEGDGTDESETGEDDDSEKPSEEDKEGEDESSDEDKDSEDTAEEGDDGEKAPDDERIDVADQEKDPEEEVNELPQLPIDQGTDSTGDLNLTVGAAAAAVPELALTLDEEEKPEYVLMNIPYDKFYENELNNDRGVDAVSSATKAKTRTGTLVGGSYHVNSDGSDITGIIFPVRLTEDVKLSGFTKITDEDSVDITVTNRGQTSTTTYSGKDALFESKSYSYYVLDEAPEYYKEATIEDGKLEFSAVEGNVTQVDGVLAELLTDSSYGDYQLNVDGFEVDGSVYAVILHTEEHDYGLRHLENIWRGTSLAWCTGFTTSVHNSPTKSFHYKSIMGESIESITYYTSDGIYELSLDKSIYVPKKFSGEMKVQDAAAAAGSTSMTITGLPEDYDAVYTMTNADGDVLEGIDVADGILSYPEDAEKGQYTLTVSDESGQYAELTATFILYTDEKPAVYNEDSSSPALTAAEGFSEEALADYISNITSVSVNGTSYAASGRGAVVIINKDGSIKTDAAPIAKTGDYEIVVSSTGYLDLEFTYSFTIDYVLMNIPYADFYQAEVNNNVEVDAVTSATKSKPRTGTLVGGSYHVNSDGSDITGITFPVKVGEGVDLSGYTRITDASSVDITVSNRGQTSTTTYAGKDALFESASYSYYILSEEPECYKEITANADGSLSFSEVVGTVETVEGAGAELSIDSSYGDYQLTIEGLDIDINSQKVYGVVLGTEEGDDYGLRHLENIWRGTNLAWSVGFTKQTHGCPLSWEHYEKIMGQTIDSITYYTSEGIYEIPLEDGIYVPVKFEGQVKVETAAVTAGAAGIAITGLPAEYQPEYTVEGLDGVAVSGNTLTWSAGEKGKYTIVITDKSGVYAPMTADFILYTEDKPAVFNGNAAAPALEAAEGADMAAFADYISNITSVSVNGRSYAASGRGAVVIINEDGTLKTDGEAFAEAGSYEIVVSSTGYLDVAFTYVKGEEVPVDPIPVDPTPADPTPADPTPVNPTPGSGGSGSGSSSGSGRTKVDLTTSSQAGCWVSAVSPEGRVTWSYQSGSSRLYAGSWAQIQNPYAVGGQASTGWFHFAADGTMETGWFTDADGHRYYLNPVSDGTQGMMLTGWQLIEGKWYYFQEKDGAPYGSLLINGQTPDGYQVGADGSRNPSA
ncbi:MAG: DUF1533 domain-containing protein [Lachnospiraceae bacterium]|nr:DUF1533 domain-containing protein [Lachnospiraceae bacterium]